VYGTGVNPCGNEDDRIATGWLRRDLNRLGFMWDAPQGTDGFGTFPFPYIRYLVVDATTKALVEDYYAWNPNEALFLPSAGVNARGHVGGTFAFAGGLVGTGAIYPQCNAFVYDDVTGNSFDMPNLGVTSGTGNPTGNRWGDYLRARMGGLNPFQWTGTCYAMEGGTPRPRIVRFGRERDTYMHDRFDWDDDGAYDIGVYRGGMWYIKDQTSFAYGAPGDILVPGDYNGDGRTEAAVYRSGMWYIKDGISVGYGGIPGDVPVPGDYNKDGKTDIAIFRDGMWYIKDYISLAYGAPGDVPVPADYDGDGRTDIAVYRDGMWYVKDVTAVPYGGVPGDLPVPADYDGDDAVDIGIYRNGMWYIKDKFTAPFGGVPGDIPVPGDFDNNGAANVAVFRSGSWYFDSIIGTTYGIGGDYPLGIPDTDADGDPY